MLLFTWAALALKVPFVLASAVPKPHGPKMVWPGWSGIERMFVFGDSYTTTGFNVSGTQPSDGNPLGNPTYPGYTSSNGPNYVDFLTTTYNKSLLQTVNLGYGGATIDSALVKPYLPTVLSIKEQVETEFIPIYAKHSPLKWRADNTLFVIFDGINDLGNAYSWANKSQIYPKIISEYAALVDTLYEAGARNLLLLQVPPVDRAPLFTTQGPSGTVPLKRDIAAWNKNVSSIATNLTKAHADATTFVFDTNAAFTQVLDDPCSHTETCPFKNTTGYCTSYENGTPTPYTYYANCTYPVDEYFWLNALHPTFRMHNVTAQEVARQLESARPSTHY